MVPVVGLVTGGTKTSRNAMGSASATAKSESMKEKSENMVNLNIVREVWGLEVEVRE